MRDADGGRLGDGAGEPPRRLSTSAGPSRLPETLSVSSLRPCRNQKPSASIEAQSPWVQTPGQRDQ